jgi:hypothetical protein
VVAGQDTTRLPVRSALSKQRTGGLVVRWVTTNEYPLLYVFGFFFAVSSDSSTHRYMDGVQWKGRSSKCETRL